MQFDYIDELRLEHFMQMHELEAKFYSEEFITPAEEAYRWYKLRPHSVVAAAFEGRIVGFINLFPIRSDLSAQIRSGSFNDAALVAEDIVGLREIASEGPCDMFLSCIVVDSGYRTQGLAVNLLRKSLEIYLPYMDFLDRIVIDVVTEDGFRFAQRLGFGFVCNSDHKSKVLTQEFDPFAQNVIRLNAR